MALVKQVLSLPFTQGLDTKSDARLSPKPSRLENSVFSTGDLSKHAGRKLLPATLDTGGSQSSGEAVFPFNQELVRINGGTAYSLAPGFPEWTTKGGGGVYCASSKTVVAASGVTRIQFDVAQLGNMRVIAWIEREGSQAGLHVMVADAVTGATYQSGATAISGITTPSIPRCIALGSAVLIIVADFSAGKLYSLTVSGSAPSTAPSATQIRTDLSSGALTFDAIAYGASYAVVAYPTGAPLTDMKLIAVLATGAVAASPAPTTFAAVALSLADGVHVQRDSAGFLYVLFGDDLAGSSKFFIATSAFGVAVATANIVTSGNWSGTFASFILASGLESPANTITFVLCINGQPGAYRLGKVSMTSAGISSAFAEIPSTVGMVLASGLVSFLGTTVFGAVNNRDSTDALQSSAWVFDLSGNPLTVTIEGASGYDTLHNSSGFPQGSYRTPPSFVSGATLSMYLPQQGRLAYQSILPGLTFNLTPLQIARADVTRVAANALPVNQLGQSVYVGGAIPRTYDGASVVSTGFQLFPIVTGASDAGAGGSLSAGTYQWRALCSWVNAKGELVRSPVSPAVSLTLAASHKATITISPMPASTKDLLPQGASVTIELYRTVANGTTFYRASSLISITSNTTGFAVISFADNLADASLQAQELLYTDGGVLDWEAPPAYSVACEHQQRLVVSPSETPLAFMPSSQWATGEQVRFSSFNIGYIPSDTGTSITGMASMDGKLILLTQSGGYVTYGDGPDQLGNNPYPSPQRISGVDAGPLPGSPCVTTPIGVLYQSVKGLTLLTRDLNQQFIGADVEAYTIGPWVVRSILVHPRLQQIHIQVDDGRDIPGALMGTMVTSQGGYRLVYDYFYSQWSVDPAWGAQGACIYQGNYTQVRSDGAAFQETPGLYFDNATPYGSVVETPWLKLAGAIQGFQRLWYVTLVGTYYSDFTLQLDVAYDYAQTEPGVPLYSSADSVTLDGAGKFTPGGTFEIRHHLGKKCEAVKFRIRDINIRGSGQGMGLTELALEYGVKGGVFRLSASKTA